MKNGTSVHFKITICFSVFLYVVYAAVPYFTPQKDMGMSRSCSCIANLKQMDSAKEQWAMDNHKPAGSHVKFADLIGVTLYIKARPKCPLGGLYILNGVGTNPTCMHEGHVLPQ